MYGAVMLARLIDSLVGESVEVNSNDGHVWWTGDIRSASALIAPLGDLAAEGGHRESKASHGCTELTIRTDARRFGPN